MLIAICTADGNKVCTDPGIITGMYTVRERGNRFLLSGNQSAKTAERMRETEPVPVTS